MMDAVRRSGLARKLEGERIAGAWIEAVLNLQDASGERARGVPGSHRHAILREDPAAVVVVIDEVDRGTALAFARCEHRLVHVLPIHPGAAEPREQCWVHVHYRAAPSAGRR